MLQFPQIDPAIFTVGPFQLRWYSLMYVIGMFAVWAFFRRGSRLGRLAMTYEQIENIMVYGLIGMIIGARFTYVFVYNLDYYMQHPVDIPAVWKGGLSFHGAFIGIALSVLLFARRHKIPYFNITDHIVTIVPVGLGFGRIGNFINGELWGRVTDAQWGMVFPDGGPLPRHPSQLYESALEGWLLLFVMLLIYRAKPKTGVLTGTFVMGYATVRFFVEFFREPDAQLGTVLGPFSMGQVLCGLMWAFGGVILIWALNRKDNDAPGAGMSGPSVASQVAGAGIVKPA